jgi:hypothetical protein
MRGRAGTDGTHGTYATYGTRAKDRPSSFQGSFFLMDGAAIRSSPESVQLHEVVPWGRSLDEYRAMFALAEGDLQGRLLGCGDGPASFNAELTELGKPRRLFLWIRSIFSQDQRSPAGLSKRTKL